MLEQAEIRTKRGLVIPAPAETLVFGGFELGLQSPLIMAALGLSVGMAALGNMSPASGSNPKHPLVPGS